MFVLMLGILIAAAVVATIIAVFRVGSDSSGLLKNFRVGFLTIAAAYSGLVSLLCLAAAAWGMNTRLPWASGVYMYLIPALSLPAFAILTFSSVRMLSYVLWLLTFTEPFAFYFGDRADRLSSGLRPIADTTERIGMFFNAFTIVLFGIAVLVQAASICASRERRMQEANGVAVV
jgi:hypothetical protein